MPAKLPKRLSPRHAMDHKIELVLKAKPPVQAPYRMSLREFAELRYQLNELLDSKTLRPSKAPYDAYCCKGKLMICCDFL